MPSIVTNINGCNEIVIDRENGIVIPVKNTPTIQKAFLNKINDPDFFTKMVKKAAMKSLFNGFYFSESEYLS